MVKNRIFVVTLILILIIIIVTSCKPVTVTFTDSSWNTTQDSSQSPSEIEIEDSSAALITIPDLETRPSVMEGVLTTTNNSMDATLVITEKDDAVDEECVLIEETSLEYIEGVEVGNGD